jgi:hypothetical protein
MILKAGKSMIEGLHLVTGFVLYHPMIENGSVKRRERERERS